MRRAERSFARQGPALDQARHRPDHRGLQPLQRRQRRQQARQTRRHHRLARTRRADEQQVVAPRGGDLQRPFGALLPLDLAQVGHGAPLHHRPRLGRAQHLGPAKMIDQADQGTRRQQPHIPRPGRLRPVRLRTDQAQPHAVDRHGRRQGPADACDLAVQPQFADRRPAVQRVRPDHAHRSQHGQGDGQIEMAALLGQVGGGQIGDHLLGGQRQADAGEGAAHPFAAFGHRLVRQSDDGEGSSGRADLLHFDVDPARIDAVERHRHHSSRHRVLSLGKENKSRTQANCKSAVRSGARAAFSRQAAAAFRCSMTAHIRSVASIPAKFSSCCAPVGEVTLISVR